MTASDPNLIEASNPAAKLAESGELAEIPEKKRAEALRRLGMVVEFLRFERAIIREEKDIRRAEAVALFAGKSGVTERSLWRWLSGYRREGLRGLVDNRGGGKFFGEIISQEAFDFFERLYLDLRRPTVKQCWLNLCYVNTDRNMGWRIPNEKAMYQIVAEHIPLPRRILLREGLSAYEARCAPYIERDQDSVEPGQVWVGDHSQFNCWIWERGRWARPWITAWEDMRSRKIVGWHISLSPNQTTILQAMKGAVEEYGTPEKAKIDNGKDYDSSMWTGSTKKQRQSKRRVLGRGYIDEQMVAGIYAMMEIAVSFAIPYNAKAKPVERFFKTLDIQFTKSIETYCGENPQARREDIQELLDSAAVRERAYDLAGFGQAVSQYVDIYNNTAHTGAGMDGKSPAEVFATRKSHRMLAEGVAELLMRVWSKEIKVGKNGVTIGGVRYGQYDTKLFLEQGRTVRAAYDPDDMSKVHIYDAKTLKLITVAEQNRLIRYGKVGESDLREAMKKQRQAKRIVGAFAEASMTANMDLTDLTLRARAAAAKEHPEPSQPETIRPVRTALDDQVREHERQAVIKAVKRASGAESMSHVLDMDFSLLKRSNKYEGVRLFNE